MDSERTSGLLERSSVHWIAVKYRYPLFPILWIPMVGLDGWMDEGVVLLALIDSVVHERSRHTRQA